MKRILALLLCLPHAATAYEQHTEYRIYGDEITNVTAPDIGHEEPMSLIISTTQGTDILIESDQPLETCQKQIERVRGDASASVQIVVNQSADTMNGIEVIQCAILYR